MEEATRFKEILNLMHKNLECAICLELLKNPVSTKCDHQFCRFCITKFFENKRYVPCPLCKVSISKRSLQERPELGNVVDKVKELTLAFESDTNKDPLKDEALDVFLNEPVDEQATSDKSITNKTPRSSSRVTENINKVSSATDRSEVSRGRVATLRKKPEDESQASCSQLHDATEEQLQNYLFETLAKSTPIGARGKQEAKDKGVAVGCEEKTLRSSSREQSANSSNNACLPSHSIEKKEKDSLYHDENESGKEKKNQDILRYLEEGSCGAVWGDTDKQSQNSKTQDSEVISSLETSGVVNKENVLRVAGEKESRGTPEPMHEASHVPPLSPSKLNVKPGPLPSNIKQTPSSLTRNDLEPQSTSVCPGKSPHMPGVTGGKMMSPDSDTASISSTQQLMKPKPVVSRTYSKDMKLTFQAEGAVRNWVGTLTSPHASKRSFEVAVPKLTGLTTKEKIAARKPKRSVVPVLENSNNSNLSDQNDEHVTNSDSKLPTPLACGRTYRKSIFKSRAEKPKMTAELALEKKESEKPQYIPVVDNGKETDPYEFQGSQTPKKTTKVARGGGSSRGRPKKGSKRQNLSFSSLGVEVMPHSKTTGPVEVLQPSDHGEKGKTDVEATAKRDRSKSEQGDQTSGGKRAVKRVQFLDVAQLAPDEEKAEASQISHLSQQCSKTLELTSESILALSETNNHELLKEGAKPSTEEQTIENEQLNVDKLPSEDRKNIGKDNLKVLPFQEALKIKNSVTVAESIPEKKKINIDVGIKGVKSKSIQEETKLLKDCVTEHTEFADASTNNELEQEAFGKIDEDVEKLRRAPRQKKGRKRAQNRKNVQSTDTVGKRTLSRRRKGTASTTESDAFKLQSETEMARLADKINEAETEDFAFCTQEAHAKMQKEQAEQKLNEEAFGFGSLSPSSEPAANVLLEKQDCGKQAELQIVEEMECELGAQVTDGNDAKLPPENLPPKGAAEKMEDKKHNSAPKGSKRVNCMDHTSDKKSKVGYVNKECLASKTEVLKETNSCQPGTIKTHHCSDNVTICQDGTELKSQSCSGNQLSSMVFPFFCTPANKSKAAHFPRPDVSLMLQVFPLPSDSCLPGSTPRSANTGVVMETPLVGDFLHKKLLGSKSKQETVEDLPNINTVPSSDNSELVLETPLMNEPVHKKLGCRAASKCDALKEMCPRVDQRDAAKTHTEAGHTAQVMALASPTSTCSVISATASTTQFGEHNDSSQKDTSRNFTQGGNEARAAIDDETAHESVQNSDRTNDSPGHQVPHDPEQEDGCGAEVLAADTCCLEPVAHPHARIEDSLQENEVKNMNLNREKPDLLVIEETQGTDTCNTPHTGEAGEPIEVDNVLESSHDNETASPAFHGYQDFKSTLLESNSQMNVNIMEAATCQEKTASQTSCIIINSATSQLSPPPATTNAKTKCNDISTTSSSCLWSQSILKTGRNLSTAGGTSATSSGTTGTVPPTAQEIPSCNFRSAKKLQEEQPVGSKNSELGGDDQMGIANQERGQAQKNVSHSQRQMNSAPARLDFSESEDEDAVLIVRRRKRKCSSLEDGKVEPVIYNTTTSNHNRNKLEAVTKRLNIADMEMVGETQALDVLDADSQDMECNTLQSTTVELESGEYVPDTNDKPETIAESEVKDTEVESTTDPSEKENHQDTIAETEVNDTETESTMVLTENKEVQSSPMVEVTPIGEVKYIEGVGRCLVGLENSTLPPDFQHPVVTGCEMDNHKSDMPSPAQSTRRRKKDEQSCVKQKQKQEQEVPSSHSRAQRSNTLNIDNMATDNSLNIDATSNEPSRMLKVDSPCSTGTNKSSPAPSSKYSESTSTSSTDNMSSDKARRTRRGLAAKLAAGDTTPVNCQALTLSAAARANISISMKVTKSKIKSSNKNKDKVSPSAPKPDVIDLEMEEVVDQLNDQSKTSPDKTSFKNKCLKEAAGENVLQKETRYNDQEGKEKKGSYHRNMANKGKPFNTSVLSKDGNDEADQVMVDLKACFNRSSDESSEDESQDKRALSGVNRNESPVPGPSNGLSAVATPRNKTQTAEIKTNPSMDHKVDADNSCPTPLSSSPVDGVQEDCQPGALEQSVITGVEESPVESDDNEDEEEDVIGTAHRGKKRLRHQINSDSDGPDEEEQSQSKSSVSSILSSQAEILTTQQAKALEGDVDLLNKEIAMYEAKLGVLPVADSVNSDSNDDEEDKEEEEDGVKNTDSASLCKRMPDVFVVDEVACTGTETAAATCPPDDDDDDDEESDDLFVSPLSPSPASKRSRSKPPPAKRTKLAEPATQMSEHFLKQFQSPGGTVRTKKQLDFVQSSMNSFVAVLPSQKAQHTGSPEEKEEEDLVERPTSPVLSSQKSKVLQGREAKEMVSGIVSKPNDRKICFVTSGLTREENATALMLANKFGIVFSSKFSSEVTHVVMKTESDTSLVCDRTLKFFQGVAHKCWVVAFSWVKTSLSADKLLPEDEFEITGDTSAGEFAGGAQQSRESEQLLFSDFCFACVGGSQEMPKESLFDLMAVCGASCVEDPIGLLSKIVKHKIIVRCSDSDVEPSRVELDMFNGLYTHMRLVTVMREWVLDSLGSYTLLPMAGYVLNTVDNVEVPF